MRTPTQNIIFRQQVVSILTSAAASRELRVFRTAHSEKQCRAEPEGRVDAWSLLLARFLSKTVKFYYITQKFNLTKSLKHSGEDPEAADGI